jgi:hypothetical protein
VGTILDWMVLLIPIGETVSHVGLQQDCWHDTTNLSCCGDQEYKRRLHCQLSTAEAEYYSASEIAVENIYLRNLVRNMGLPQEDDTPVYEDNTACIEWGNHVIGGR